jgi:hypothetical protein
MADLDRDLSNRLSRLAAAVPVARGQLDPVHGSAVAARQAVRLAWITPLVVIVVAILGASLLWPARQSAPGATPSSRPTGTPPVGTGTEPPVSADRDGDFDLVLRSGKALYAPNEPIDVSAALTYRGVAGSIEIKHDSSGPIMFGIREKVFGEINVGAISILMWDRTTFERGVPIVSPFVKGGGFTSDGPNAAMYRAWLQDPVLRLPEGTWHLYAAAAGSTLTGDVQFDLSTEIEIVVDDDPTATPGHPPATENPDKPVYGGDDIGYMTLQVKSEHPTYEAGSPVDLDTYYSFAEGPPRSEQPFIQQAAFTITQVDAAARIVRSVEPDPGCQETTLARLEERHVPIDDRNVVYISAVSWPQASADALERGVLALPVGRWRITAVVTASFGPCGAPDETWQVHASVEIDVLPPG